MNKAFYHRSSKARATLCAALCAWLVLGGALPAFPQSKKGDAGPSTIKVPSGQEKSLPSTKGKEAPAKTVPALTAAIGFRLEARDSRVYLDLSRPPAWLEILTGGKSLKKLAGKGRTRFDVSDYIPRAKNNRLEFAATGGGGKRFRKSFDVAKYAAAMAPGKTAAGGAFKAAPAGRGAPPPGTPGQLAVERVYLKKSGIHVVIRNRGPGDVSKETYARARLTLQTESRHSSWPLSKVGPLRRFNNRPREVDFDSGFVPEGAETVTAKLLNVPGAKALVARLATPFEPDRVRRIKKKPFGEAVVRSGPAGVPEIKKSPSGLPTITLLPSGLQAPPPGGDPVPLFIDGGIYISEPAEGSRSFVSGMLTVRLRFTRDVEPATPFTLRLRRHSAPGREWTIHEGSAGDAALDEPIRWRMPFTVAVGEDYYVRADAGDLYGEGHDFTVTLIRRMEPGTADFTEPLIILSPDSGDTWLLGSRHAVRWRAAAPIGAPAIALRRDDETVYPVPSRDMSGVLTDPATGVSAVEFRLPGAVVDGAPEPGGGYRLRVVSSAEPDMRADSLPFTLTDSLYDIPDLSLSNIRTDEARHLLVNVFAGTRQEDFSRDVTFRLARLRETSPGAFRTTAAWDVVRRVRGMDSDVDLGELSAFVDSVPVRCGALIEITADGPNAIVERSESNNTARQELYLVPVRGISKLDCASSGNRLDGRRIEVMSGWAPSFHVDIKNCGTDYAEGEVFIRQVGSWVAGHDLSPREHERLLGRLGVRMAPGDEDLVILNENDPLRTPSRIEVLLSGDLVRWSSENPIVYELVPY